MTIVFVYKDELRVRSHPLPFLQVLHLVSTWILSFSFYNASSLQLVTLCSCSVSKDARL